MNSRLNQLAPYPFERLRALVADVVPNPELTPMSLGIGEPQHAPPKIVLDSIAESLSQTGHYPTTTGTPELRETIAQWLTRRFNLAQLNANREVLPVNGTREALFAMVQAWVDGGRVAMPNPFYQIYEGAAFMAGALPIYIPCAASNDFLMTPDQLPDDDIRLVFLCTPGNPSGAVMPEAMLHEWIKAARQRNFILVSDECYSELYRDEPPVGLLQAASSLDGDLTGLIAVGSLSKRSNLPGMRSGYVAGDGQLLEQFTRYRTYHGCAMPGHHQVASVTAWRDEAHVQENRRLYNEKYQLAQQVLGHHYPGTPRAGFYLWIPVPGGDDEGLTRHLLKDYNLKVLAGRYLGRDEKSGNPGAGYIRTALVSAPEITREALERLKSGLDDWEKR